MTKTRIGLIHATMNSVAPIHRAFSLHSVDVALINFMDEGLIYELNATNKITTRMIFRLCELAGKAVESKVDAILFTCSSFTPYISKIASLLPVPVLSSDISMLQEAVKRSANISIVATVQTAAPTTKGMLFELAKKQKKKIEVNTYFISKAFHELQKGNESGHDKLIQDKIDEIDAPAK
ncbi:aspartate/glutamate racemase family protein [Bacillus inaquosorum]|uniref:aspartate/glutamate racemase family protein n=1 Tax=Bacillus inaquosorum TaxID=483913 RepID=UPI00228031E1|nr:aspartate/glutamate racemase family protein [Bacillus inaquosorum]MCY9069586.1 aspartate/glutamate racemase family protein [Bacillus inaquosorum]